MATCGINGDDLRSRRWPLAVPKTNPSSGRIRLPSPDGAAYSPKSGYTPIDGGAGYCDRQRRQSRRRYAASQEAIDSFCAYSPHSIKTHHIHGIPTLDGTLFEQRTNTMLSVIHMLFGLVQLGSLRNMKRATRHQASHHDAGLRNQRIKAHDIGYQKKTPKRIVHVA